jgi:threonine dehydrogenase-like Zn-dependent dehydrogenase
MRTLAVKPGDKGVVAVERPEPQIRAADEILLRVLRVGICGTDREEAAGGRAQAPRGEDYLVIGHEMLGQVAEAGEAVKRVKPGDLALFTVRRPCGRCLPCRMDRPDMCQTGKYHERGIRGQDGYQAEWVVDREAFVIPVPGSLAATAVLTEPLSIGEKAIEEAVRIQNGRLPDAASRPDPLNGRRVLVAGIGAVGLLAALALRLRGAEVVGLDIVDAGSRRPLWLEAIGGSYVDGRGVPPDEVDKRIGRVDMIFEATGVPSLEFSLFKVLATNGIYVLTGIPGGDRPVQVAGAEIIRNLVLQNQLMFGSVNASRDHYQMAVRDLQQASLIWGGHIAGLITKRYAPGDHETAFGGEAPDEIKAVVEWAS